MKRKASKPKKPYPDFPLFPHASGQWAKKIRGRTYYFGKIEDHQAAIDKYQAQKDDLQAGREPRANPGGLTVRDLVNRFLTSKKLLVASGELSIRTWSDYFTSCEHLVDALGKTRVIETLTGKDFEDYRADLAKRRGPVSLGNEVQRVRTLLKFAWDEGLIEKPMRFGSSFKKPSRKAMRRARHQSGPRMIEAAGLRNLLAAAGTPMKAMILLGLNAGFGQSDIASLPMKALDLAGGWVSFPRPKTEILRRCPLWPETIEAIREAIKERPTPKAAADAGLAFITKYGARWVRAREHEGKASVNVDSVRLEFNKLLVAHGLKSRGIGFYTLRHVFRTVADASKDSPAIDRIMGHADESMGDLYRERIDDERLKAVTDLVRKWLYAES